MIQAIQNEARTIKQAAKTMYLSQPALSLYTVALVAGHIGHGLATPMIVGAFSKRGAAGSRAE